MKKSDIVLDRAKKALNEWKKNVTIEKFIEDHKRLGLDRKGKVNYINKLKTYFSMIVKMFKK